MLWFVLGDEGLLYLYYSHSVSSWECCFWNVFCLDTVFRTEWDGVAENIINIGKSLSDISLVVWQGDQHHFLWLNCLCSVWTVFHHNIL